MMALVENESEFIWLIGRTCRNGNASVSIATALARQVATVGALHTARYKDGNQGHFLGDDVT